MKPRIALTLGRPNTPARVDANRRYVEALERAGAQVVEVYPGDVAPADVDGLLLSGGVDINPDRYGAENTDSVDMDDERDQTELAVARLAIDRDLPVLGICRGFQVLNVAFGGTLVQHVDDHEAPEEGEVNEHEVRAAAGSRLAAAVGQATLTVNSRHHQAVTPEILGAALVPTVRLDGLIEAFEAADRRWIVGVQWHPERSEEVSEGARRIFDALVAEATPQR